jgi:tetratricopeptide (TPR) repeat protein
VNPIGYFNLGVNYLSVGRQAEAIASFHYVLRLSPGYIGARYQLGTALLFQGNASDALDVMRQEQSDVFRIIGLAMVYQGLGEEEYADATLAEFIAGDENEAACNIAYVLAYRNEADLAFEWPDKAVKTVDPGLSGIVAQPEFGSLHGDPR